MLTIMWDVTVCTTVADYLAAASHAAGAVTEQAADRKCLKYTELSATYEFQPACLIRTLVVSYHAFDVMVLCIINK